MMRLTDSFKTISSRDTSYTIEEHDYDFIFSEGFKESKDELLYEFFGVFNDLEKPLVVIAYGPLDRFDAQKVDKFINSIQIKSDEQ